MHKLLIIVMLASSTLLVACSGASNIGNAIPNAVDRMPFIYRPTIQQGNIVSQDAVNQLQPGMTSRQVRFVLGTPMLEDTFHQNRSDYVYTIGVGSRPEEITRTTLVFENDRLVRIEGDRRPQPPEEQTPREKEIVVEVPDWEGEQKGLLGRVVDSVTWGDDDD
jgi:outer membrane protein assembly factor BamE